MEREAVCTSSKVPEETFSEQDRVNILMDFVKQGYYQQAGAFVKQFSEPFYQIIVSQPFVMLFLLLFRV